MITDTYLAPVSHDKRICLMWLCAARFSVSFRLVLSGRNRDVLLFAHADERFSHVGRMAGLRPDGVSRENRSSACANSR
ncbi:MAG TPA: hypothetical protein PKH23_00765, partial [Bacillota bacterium]|nr:hypothetical protein [Bacillota bacterium]